MGMIKSTCTKPALIRKPDAYGIEMKLATPELQLRKQNVGGSGVNFVCIVHMKLHLFVQIDSSTF